MLLSACPAVLLWLLYAGLVAWRRAARRRRRPQSAMDSPPRCCCSRLCLPLNSLCRRCYFCCCWWWWTKRRSRARMRRCSVRVSVADPRRCTPSSWRWTSALDGRQRSGCWTSRRRPDTRHPPRACRRRGRQCGLSSPSLASQRHPMTDTCSSWRQRRSCHPRCRALERRQGRRLPPSPPSHLQPVTCHLNISEQVYIQQLWCSWLRKENCQPVSTHWKKFSLTTRRWPLDRVQTHAGHSIAWNVFAFMTLLPWPLTFWLNIKWVAWTHDGLSLWQVWWL